MYKPHQEAASDAALKILEHQGLVAIFGLPRTGKTRAAIRTAEQYGARKVLVLTRKAAIPGWRKELDAVQPAGDYLVTNYEQVSKLEGGHDLLILDESHNLGCRGRATNRVKDIRALCYNLPLICLTGTPTIETPLGIYHQWCVSKYSPFRRMKNFYAFFREYGIPSPVWVNGRMIEQYKKALPSLEPVIEKYAVRISQEEAGIEHQAQDFLHTVPLANSTRVALDLMATEGCNGRMVFDTDMGVRTALHQFEAGAVLYEEELVMLPNTEVVDYLWETFGDQDDIAYMTHFRSTRKKLSQRFKKAQLLSSIANAEGVDLSHMRHFVIVNTGYSGSKFAQLRERITNMNRTTPAIVHHIITDGGVSADVYQAVSMKKDYNLAAFRSKRSA